MAKTKQPTLLLDPQEQDWQQPHWLSGDHDREPLSPTLPPPTANGLESWDTLVANLLGENDSPTTNAKDRGAAKSVRDMGARIRAGGGHWVTVEESGRHLYVDGEGTLRVGPGKPSVADLMAKRGRKTKGKGGKGKATSPSPTQQPAATPTPSTLPAGGTSTGAGKGMESWDDLHAKHGKGKAPAAGREGETAGAGKGTRKGKPAGTTKDATTKPPPGPAYHPDVTRDANGDGVADAARVGVPAMEVPPPPPVGQLPNLTRHERQVEKSFRDAYHKDPDGMAKQFLGKVHQLAEKNGTPPTFGTDDAKVLHKAWEDPKLSKEQRAKNRATLNCALHQTANAITKRAFLQHLDTLKPGDSVMVTVGGCGCHARDTLVMMADGSVKMVQDIEAGDELMGPDSNPRRVLWLIRGVSEMYDVVPKKGKPFRVNGSHVLSLVTNRGPGTKKRTKKVQVEMTVDEYLGKSASFQRSCLLHRAAVDFPSIPVALDPYFLGIWLGNGVHCNTTIVTADVEVAEFVTEFATDFIGTKVTIYDKESLRPGEENKAKDYCIVNEDRYGNRSKPNPVLELLKQVGVFRNKHIPSVYLHNGKHTRLRLLAGLLDTDGCYSHGVFEFSTKHERMAYDVAYLARSLGLAAYVKSKWVKSEFLEEERCYWRVAISGNVEMIPTLVARKQAVPRRINKDALRVGFAIVPAGQGSYYGFTLDGDGLYLLDDFTVTHNSGKGWSIKNNPEVKSLMSQSKAVWDSAGDQNATENPWIQQEAEKRGLKVHYAYVHADPYTQWAHPERGVVKRAGDPNDGRMVDADVFADSYAEGAKNHQAFYEKHKNNPNANFVFLSAGKKIDGIPKAALNLDRDHLAFFAKEVVTKGTAPAHVKRGATVGERIWE